MPEAILPPGPSPVYRPFPTDPMRYQVTSAPVAPVMPNIAEEFRQQVNAQKFKTAQDALEAATAYQRLRLYERARSMGMDYGQALAETIRLAPPQHAARIFDATRPIPAPSKLELPGLPAAVRSGRYGERVQFVPQSAMPKPDVSEVRTVRVVNPDGSVSTRFVATPQGRILTQEGLATTKQSPSVRRGLIKDEIEGLESELLFLDRNIKDKTARATRKSEIETELKRLRAERKAMLALEPEDETKPTRVRVREKATGKKGYWTGGPVPEGYEVITDEK